MRHWWIGGLALLACTEYEVNLKTEAVGPGEPEDTSVLTGELAVDPARIDATGCTDIGATVELSNVGAGSLSIYGIAVEGGVDWTVSSPDLPLDLGPGESHDLALVGQLGSGVLVILSDDPVQPRVTVPLSTAEDGPPTVEIVAPAHDSIIDIGTDLELLGRVGDDSDSPENLAVEWVSSLDGVVGSPVADAAGEVRTAWASPDRAGGPHQLTFSATDTCGNTASTDITLCQQAGYTTDEYDIALWHFEGSAQWDTSNNWLQLTHVDNNLVGSAFQTANPVTGDAVSIRFQFFIGNGTGADGLSLTALDTSRMSGYLGGTGCGIGYGGDASCTAGPALPGWSIEIDTYFNGSVDPTDQDHLTFVFDGDVDDPAAWAALPEMEDTGWHNMEVTVAAPRVTVAVDSVVYIDQDLSGNFAFPAYVGFTAGTGGLTNEHLIDALEVEGFVCE